MEIFALIAGIIMILFGLANIIYASIFSHFWQPRGTWAFFWNKNLATIIGEKKARKIVIIVGIIFLVAGVFVTFAALFST